MAKKKLTARGRDIERLTKQYQTELGDVSKQYESVLAVPSGLDDFQKQSADYQKRLQDYRALIEDIQKTPNERINAPVRQAGRSGRRYTINGQEYGEYNLPENYFIEPVVIGTTEVKNRSGQVTGTRNITEDQLFRVRNIPSFTEEAPKPPDTTERDAALAKTEEQRKTLGEAFQREMGERRASRVGAVSRRSQSRPMLSKGVAL